MQELHLGLNESSGGATRWIQRGNLKMPTEYLKWVVFCENIRFGNETICHRTDVVQVSCLQAQVPGSAHPNRRKVATTSDTP